MLLCESSSGWSATGEGRSKTRGGGRLGLLFLVIAAAEFLLLGIIATVTVLGTPATGFASLQVYPFLLVRFVVVTFNSICVAKMHHTQQFFQRFYILLMNSIQLFSPDKSHPYT